MSAEPGKTRVIVVDEATGAEVGRGVLGAVHYSVGDDRLSNESEIVVAADIPRPEDPAVDDVEQIVRQVTERIEQLRPPGIARGDLAFDIARDLENYATDTPSFAGSASTPTQPRKPPPPTEPLTSGAR